MSNLGLKLAAKNLGIGLAITNVGDRYVLEKMLKDDFGINHVTLQTEYQSCKNHDELIQK